MDTDNTKITGRRLEYLYSYILSGMFDCVRYDTRLAQFITVGMKQNGHGGIYL